MPHTLLLADDSVTIQRVIELTFASEDIRVVSVGDGDHAIATIRHSPPDIVLADVGMPGRSGYDVAKHIKDTPALAHIPVLLLTGAFEPIDRARADDVRCDGVLIKPFEPRLVIDRVRELLGMNGDRAPEEAPAAPATAVSHLDPIPYPTAGDPVPGTPLPEAPRPSQVVPLDDYFDTLDQAIAARAAEPPPFAAPTETIRTVAAADSAVVNTQAARETAVADARPGLAGAFSALLEAEESGSAPSAFTAWLPEEPSPPPEPRAVPPTHLVDDALIEGIVRRVLARLPDTVVRDAVRTITSETAERLVREEIERIKSNIK